MNAFMYIACALIWGLNFIVVKVQGTANALEVSLFYRTLIALLLFMVLYVLRIRAKQHTLPHHVWATVAGFGACSFALSYLLLYHATIYSNAALVALIFSLKVMVTPLLIAAVFKTPVSKRVFWGGMLGMAGVGVIVVPNLGLMQMQFVWGLGFAIAGTLVTAVGGYLVVLQQPAAGGADYGKRVWHARGIGAGGRVHVVDRCAVALAPFVGVLVGFAVFGGVGFVCCVVDVCVPDSQYRRGQRQLHGGIVSCDCGHGKCIAGGNPIELAIGVGHRFGNGGSGSGAAKKQLKPVNTLAATPVCFGVLACTVHSQSYHCGALQIIR